MNNKVKIRAKVFIDGSNIYFAQKKMNKWLDWVKVKAYLESEYDIVEYRYYIGVRKNDTLSTGFIKKLQKIGFKVLKKTIKVVQDDFRRSYEKANVDVEITADVMLSIKDFDVLVLFSGDSDFVYLRSVLKKFNKEMVVFSARANLAWELKLSGKYIFFEDLPELTKGKEFAKL